VSDLFPNVRGQAGEPVAFRFFATNPRLVLELTAGDPDAHRVVFDQFSLTGQITGDRASFVLKGMARLKNPKGGELMVLSGGAALTELGADKPYRIEHRKLRTYLVNAGESLEQIAQRHGLSAAELA